MKQTDRLFTVDDYLKFPESAPVQLINGALVMEPAPTSTHQQIILNLALVLVGTVRARNLGRIYLSPLDVFLSKHNILQPDLLFVAKENLGILKEDGLHGAPDLAVEVLSPKTARIDLTTKKRLYRHYGTRELWIVDPPGRQIFRYDFKRNGSKRVATIAGNGSFSSPLFPRLVIAAVEIFRE